MAQDVLPIAMSDESSSRPRKVGDDSQWHINCEGVLVLVLAIRCVVVELYWLGSSWKAAAAERSTEEEEADFATENTIAFLPGAEIGNETWRSATG